jgi:hypothetical protein
MAERNTLGQFENLLGRQELFRAVRTSLGHREIL